MRPAGSRVTLALACLACLLALPGVARAQCGSTLSERAKQDRTAGRPPLAIGDSSMLVAVEGLAEAGISANARGCRQYPEALDLLRKKRRRGNLPRLVIIALGANGSVRRADVHEALRIVGRKRMLALATPREYGGRRSKDARIVRSEARRHRRIRLLDWAKASAGHRAWFQPDGLHLTTAGAAAFVRLCEKVFRWLAPPP